MKNGKWLYPLLGAVVVAAICALVPWHSRLNSENNTQKAFGADITLKRVEAVGPGKVKAVLLVKRHKRASALPLKAGGAELRGIEADLEMRSCGYYWPNGDIEVTYTFKVPPHTRYVTVAQEIHLQRPSRTVKFEFANATSSKLPLTRRIENATFTLNKVAINKIAGRNYDYIVGHEDKCCMFFVEQGYPRNCTQGQAQLRDNKGRTYGIAQQIPDFITPYKMDVAVERAVKKIAPPTLAEKAIALVSMRAAEKMHKKRVLRALKNEMSKSGINENCIYAFPALKQPPRNLILTIKGILPPKGKDRRWVVFKNVAVQHPGI